FAFVSARATTRDAARAASPIRFIRSTRSAICATPLSARSFIRSFYPWSAPSPGSGRGLGRGLTRRNDRLDARRRAEQDHVGAATCEKPDGHHARDSVDPILEGRRVVDPKIGNVEDRVAV